MNEKTFIGVLLVLQVAAAAVYISKGDWRKVVYWTAAAALTFVVTW